MTVDPAAFEAIEDDWNEAMVANDADRIAAFMTDDWALVTEHGITSAEQFLANIRSGTLRHLRMASTGRPRVAVYGDAAVFSVRVVSTASFAGQRFDADEWTTDVFVRRGDKWLCASTQLTPALDAYDQGSQT
ncbi:nuclear transport factor 2 family protein [Fodinicola acaciae]|uniref:nuclear transport factor 2 family protein n=1 Tax=Fodinicola acaciae TaxID=2681555 RepID=UPI0013D74699|nr:nuclear transport factor 2 family protein [Fodinicola acaciae]